MAGTEILSAVKSSAFDTAAATRAYLDSMPPDQAAQTASYHEGQIWLIPISAAVSLLVAYLILQSGLARGLRDSLEGKMPAWLAVFPFAFVFFIVSSVLELPYAYYEGFIREHSYGLATQSTLEWLTASTYQNYFYQYMFLMHVVFGLLIILPVIVFGMAHMANARRRSQNPDAFIHHCQVR